MILAIGVFISQAPPRGSALGESRSTATEALKTTTDQAGKGEAIHSVRIGLLRIRDAVPFIVAFSEGLFLKYGINASIEFYGSAKDRDSAMVSGLIDISLNDPISTLMMIDKGMNVKIISLLLGQYPQDLPIFILLPPGSQGTALCVEEIAVARNTVTEFAAWKLLEILGCDPRSVKWIDVPSILNRFQLLVEGRVKAAAMPEPWNVLAVARGAKILASTTNMSKPIAMSIVIARGDLADQDLVKRLRNALNEALDLYRANPERYRDLIERSISIPEDLRGRWLPEIRGSLVDYPKENFDLVASWLLERGLIARKPAYSDVVVTMG